METFEGGVAVVTGGASGLGLAMAQRFADAGMNIVLGDIEAEPLAMAEADIAARGVKVLPKRTDVAKAEDVEALARAPTSISGPSTCSATTRASAAAPAQCGNSPKKTGAGLSM